MKHSIIGKITAVLLGAGLMLAAGVTRAAETEAKIAVPATTAGILRAIDKHLGELRTMVAGGQLEGLHLHAYEVRDLVRELPGHSADLPAAERASISRLSKFVDTLADRLDRAGDGNDETAAKSDLRKLEGVLKMIGGHYPAPR